MQQSFREKLKQPKRWLRSWIAVWVNGYPTRQMRVVGITGTDGKTTTCMLTYEILKEAKFNVGVVTTVGIKYFVDGKETFMEMGLHVTNPDAPVMQKLLKTMKDAGVKVAVLEVTSHRLAQLKTVGYNVEVGVLTNLTREHLDYHGTMDNYARAKLRLFMGVRYAVLNKEDEWFRFFREQIVKNSPQTKIIEYAKTSIKKISPRLGGEYNKYNISAAVEVASIFGVDLSVVEKVIQSFPGVLGRREEVENKLGIRMIVDFAHTPNALEKLLISLRDEMGKKGKLILVFGCTGERDRGKRPEMGLVAEKFADEVVVTADDPRSEDLGEIYEQITLKTQKKFLRVDDRDEAILTAVKMANKGDVVVASGMGHEKTILIGKKEISRSDRAAFERVSLV